MLLNCATWLRVIKSQARLTVMTELSNTYPVGNFPMLLALAQFAKRLVGPIKGALTAPAATGLSVADIADVSRYATEKNGLEVRRKTREI